MYSRYMNLDGGMPQKQSALFCFKLGRTGSQGSSRTWISGALALPDAGYDDYMSFLCGINGSSPVVLNYTGQNCLISNSTLYGPDLNLPVITISKLNQSRVVQRTIQNIAGNETSE